jgi:HlyD family secretion protein
MRILKNPRLVASVLVVAAIAAVAMWPDAAAVDAARVVRGPMRVTIDEEGETRVRERFVVSAPVAGRLERIELEPGDPVVRGKTIVARLMPAAAPLIDPRERAELSASVEAAQAAVGQARAERARAAAAVARARSSLRRQEALTEAGAISRDELELAQTTLKTAEEEHRAAEFTVTRAEYELQLSRARLSPSIAGGRTVDVLAPVDGTVLRRLRESATVVPVGEPLVEIGDAHNLEIVADLLSTDAVRVSPGNAALIEQWGGSDPLQARVRRVEPSGFMKVSALGVEEQRVNVILDFADANGAVRQLGDGYRVEVRVVIWNEPSVVKVPIGSLFRRGDAWAVFAIEGDRARLKTVRVGQRNDREAQVVEGLAEGTTVVMHPPDTLADDARVTIRTAPEAATGGSEP